MEFSESLEYFLDNYNYSFSELNSDEYVHSDEEETSQLDESSNKETMNKESENIISISEIAINECIKKLQQCCLCKRKCSEKISSDLLQHLPSKNILLNKTVNKVKLFIKSIGEQQGEALAVRKYTRKRVDRKITVSYEKDNVVLLLSHYSYIRLLALSKILIRKPSKDVCDKCILYKHALKESINNTNENIDQQLTMHILDYQAMKDIYKNNIKEAKTCDHSLFCVFSFDFTQNIELPHNSQQPGNEGIDKHWHCVYTEGKALKKANEVTSMLYFFLISKIGKAKEI
ncbi:9596_t:CDS:2 [Cetraspora pellucida]|uniref:9596_t:CDS:1 n=1 Tax=Cetraspora pellucida TaxID=1433469 RepID=A0A9N9BCT9_9GLOM|nr:9596_t:CDS:2 [Cetraspora pellucida]